MGSSAAHWAEEPGACAACALAGFPDPQPILHVGTDLAVCYRHLPADTPIIDQARGLKTLGSPAQGATFSMCSRYRYGLWRLWRDPYPEAPLLVNWLMLNPSTADHREDDATVRKITAYSQAWGYDGLVVTNLYAWRATDPKELACCADPIGPRNDDVIKETAKTAALVVCGWGAHGKEYGRSRQVRRMLEREGVKPQRLVITQGGEPGHPLYLAANLAPVPL